ncbi:MAG: helix-turn-helix transcriptional regulator [Bacteroidales bacterium]|jgi:DNA-binding transcriptional ArsR family regulator|nr:helix-turn-helix transcriptional regulator [Bacteroidales bacterium]
MMKFNELNPEMLERASGLLKTIAHPARLAIVSLLENGNRLSVSEIHRSLGMEQSVASRHLVILKDRGILSSEREGRNIYYYLKISGLGDMLGCLAGCCSG